MKYCEILSQSRSKSSRVYTLTSVVCFYTSGPQLSGGGGGGGSVIFNRMGHRCMASSFRSMRSVHTVETSLSLKETILKVLAKKRKGMKEDPDL